MQADGSFEEAVLMCDRILVFSTNPGRVVSEIRVSLPQPRDRLDPAFRELVERIYVEMTARPAGSAHGPRAERFPGTGIGTILPAVSSNLLVGLLERVAGTPYEGKADLPEIASSLHMDADDLFPVAEMLQMLRFAVIEGGDIRLTEAGVRFSSLSPDERKRLFAHHLLSYVPLAAHIRRVLDERASHMAPKTRFLDELEDHMTANAAEQTLRAVVDWGRYAEVFAYDFQKATFSLENPT
jgi:NitT/TauT family transport system ATP-binding protein